MAGIAIMTRLASSLRSGPGVPPGQFAARDDR
jgi:hypothetical protein